jgi:putative ABC transport system permease protein
LNETAVNGLGWKDPIGKKFRFSWVEEMGTVIGVVKDFHNLPLHVPSEPVVLRLSPNANWYMSVKIQAENLSETVAAIENIWKRFTNGWPFVYEFMDEAYDRMYKSELRMNNLFRTFSAIAIFLSCLGLFGLASFTAERRTKEIGIRKVLGASVSEVAGLLTKDFAKCVLLANIIAWPVAYFSMKKWLENFAYRTDLGLGVFIAASLAAFCIALLTVSYQSIKAATANPVDALRYE